MTPANESAALAGGADPRAHSRQLKDGESVTPPDQIRKNFARDFASSAFREIDGQNYILGKYGRISQFPDGTYDAWFVGLELAPLSGRRVAQIVHWCREHYPQAHIQHLDGEAVCTWVAGRQFVLDMAELAGVRRKRQVSVEEHARLTARIQALRATPKHAFRTQRPTAGRPINELTTGSGTDGRLNGVQP